MTYDAAGNRQSLTAPLPSDATYAGTTSYTYDSKNERKTEQSTRNGNYTNSVAYDNAKNPTTFRSGTMAGYNADNQTTAANYAYDGNGNQTDYGETPLTFDAENRLTAYGGQLTAGYGTDDLRAWKTDSSGTAY